DKGIDLFQFIQKKLGNGGKTLFWEDIWLGDIAFKDLFQRLYALEESKYISVADKLGRVSLCQSFRRPPRGGIEHELLDLLCLKVDNIMLPNMADRWSWSLEGSGVFSVKSSHILIDDIYLPKAEVPTRWVNVLLESTSHLFFSCPVARRVWRKILNWWELDDVVFHSYNDWILWLVNIRLPKKLKEFFEGVCYVLWWLVWRFTE
nr:RNA-directed DNA polymerase, eukaryota [Tanacetum cinerariifolium]